MTETGKRNDLVSKFWWLTDVAPAQRRFVPRQATYLAAYRVPGRACASAPRHRYPRAPGRPNYQHRSFDFSVQRPLKYPHVRPQMGNFATASRLESGPFPPARSRGVQRDPTTKIAGGQVAGNSNLKLGDRPRTVTDVVTVTTN